jgi:hypothetical protein
MVKAIRWRRRYDMRDFSKRFAGAPSRDSLDPPHNKHNLRGGQSDGGPLVTCVN